MIFSRIDFEFNDFIFILIMKSLIASLKSIACNEIIIISETLFVSNSIFYFFLFLSTRFSIAYNGVVTIFETLSNSIDSLSFFSKLSFFSLFFLIFNKKIIFDFDLNLLIFKIKSKTSTFFFVF